MAYSVRVQPEAKDHFRSEVANFGIFFRAEAVAGGHFLIYISTTLGV